MGGGRDIHIGTDLRTTVAAAAARWAALADEAVRERGAFHVALAGGSTPRALYETLAGAPWRDDIDWRASWIWFGDERCVPPTHEDSNYRMAQETLLSRVDCPPSQVQRMEGERDPHAAARDYQRLLEERLPREELPDLPPRLDLVLLGLGPDGHIASLFPDTPILDQRGTLVDAVFVPRLSAWRVSLTYPLIEAARRVMMLVTGESKADIVAAVLADRAPELPVARLRPQGSIEWYVDRAAARGLPAGGAT